jgi:hypothetical protein
MAYSLLPFSGQLASRSYTSIITITTLCLHLTAQIELFYCLQQILFIILLYLQTCTHYSHCQVERKEINLEADNVSLFRYCGLQRRKLEFYL